MQLMATRIASLLPLHSRYPDSVHSRIYTSRHSSPVNVPRRLKASRCARACSLLALAVFQRSEPAHLFGNWTNKREEFVAFTC
jgi:hypothetical protein